MNKNQQALLSLCIQLSSIKDKENSVRHGFVCVLIQTQAKFGTKGPYWIGQLTCRFILQVCFWKI